jgi:hypothetical protein
MQSYQSVYSLQAQRLHSHHPKLQWASATFAAQIKLTGQNKIGEITPARVRDFTQMYLLYQWLAGPLTEQSPVRRVFE